jgi:hypothetical protein
MMIAVPAVVRVTESLPRRIRAGALGFIYACSIAVFGGSTQFVLKWLLDETQSPLAPAWSLTAALLVGGIAIATMRESGPHRIR